MRVGGFRLEVSLQHSLRVSEDQTCFSFSPNSLSQVSQCGAGGRAMLGAQRHVAGVIFGVHWWRTCQEVGGEDRRHCKCDWLTGAVADLLGPTSPEKAADRKAWR